MPFPDERDRNIIRRAEQVENLATDLCDWLSEFNAQRRRTELLPVNESDEFEVLQLRRLASSLYTSSKVPVAAAAYGASQVGKSLFMGQVLRPQSENYCPIGGDETLGEPAYYKNLSFDNDLNPQCGSQEATALVTRFTTKDRIGAGVSPQYPVMVRALTRAEWLRVLARGFHAECKTPATTWQQAELETLFEDLARKFPDQQVDRKWRMDILDAFSYMRAVDRRGFQATEAAINGLLSRYPLTEDGYVAAAAALFWDSWPSLTSQFNKVAAFLKRITLGNHDPAIFCHWAGVRFLLDSQRSKSYERPNSKIWKHVAWNDIYLTPKEKYFVLDYRPNTGMGTEELETIQARHVGAGHARAAAPPQRRLAAGNRADGLSRRARHEGRPHRHRAGQADQRRLAGRADGDRQARQGLVPFRALRRRIADPDAVPPAPRRQPGSQGRR